MAHIEIYRFGGKHSAQGVPHNTVLTMPDSVRDIIRRVADEYSLSVVELLSRQTCWVARHEAVRAVRAGIKLGRRSPSYHTLAQWFGRNDSTIRHALGTWAPHRPLQPKRADRSDTQCRHGHELTDDNVYLYGNRKVCRTCRRTHMRAYKARQVAA